MHQRISAPGAVLLAMAVFALPAWGADGISESVGFAAGTPKVFAVAELQGWLAQPQLQAGGGFGGASAAMAPTGRRRGETYESRRWSQHHTSSAPESYMLLKGGGLRVSEDPVTMSGFFGIEMGGTMENVVQLGLSVDYLYNRTSQMNVLQESETNGLPVRAEQTISESVAHLVPIGLTMRVRLPIASSPITPFFSGTLSYEMLFLERRGVDDSNDPLLSLLGDRATFTGFGWQAAVGLDLELSPTFGLIGEFGWHRSSPSKEVYLDGQAVDLKFDFDGPFMRGGLRIFM